jgi:hypothetical protein
MIAAKPATIPATTPRLVTRSPTLTIVGRDFCPGKRNPAADEVPSSLTIDTCEGGPT